MQHCNAATASPSYGGHWILVFPRLYCTRGWNENIRISKLKASRSSRDLISSRTGQDCLESIGSSTGFLSIEKKSTGFLLIVIIPSVARITQIQTISQSLGEARYTMDRGSACIAPVQYKFTFVNRNVVIIHCLLYDNWQFGLYRSSSPPAHTVKHIWIFEERWCNTSGSFDGWSSYDDAACRGNKASSEVDSRSLSLAGHCMANNAHELAAWER